MLVLLRHHYLRFNSVKGVQRAFNIYGIGIRSFVSNDYITMAFITFTTKNKVIHIGLLHEQMMPVLKVYFKLVFERIVFANEKTKKVNKKQH